MSERTRVQKIAFSGVLVALSVIFSTVAIPVAGARVAPVQHFVDVVGVVALGPVYAVVNAFLAALIRNLLGTGTPLAFVAVLAPITVGIIYFFIKKPLAAAIGEIVGVGALAGIAAYPVAVFLMGREVGLFAFVIPFSLSGVAGSVLAYIFIKIPVINRLLTGKSGASTEKIPSADKDAAAG
jgi:energy coupling factor transporter S component ThiW